jgi:hypothetical protein
MPKFKFGTLVDSATVITARVADGTGTGNQLTDADVGKLLKLVGDSQYGLCAVGNEIEGALVAANFNAPADGFNLGSVAVNGEPLRLKVTFDGLQATPGTGTIGFGDYVVAGTVVARGTSLNGAPPRVCRATNAGNTLVYKWRVVSLDGTGAVGQTGLIERVS